MGPCCPGCPPLHPPRAQHAIGTSSVLENSRTGALDLHGLGEHCQAGASFVQAVDAGVRDGSGIHPKPSQGSEVHVQRAGPDVRAETPGCVPFANPGPWLGSPSSSPAGASMPVGRPGVPRCAGEPAWRPPAGTPLPPSSLPAPCPKSLPPLLDRGTSWSDAELREGRGVPASLGPLGCGALKTKRLVLPTGLVGRVRAQVSFSQVAPFLFPVLPF